MLTRAILRRPGTDFAAGITTAGLGQPDPARMLAQHAAYAEALRSLGLAVEVLEPLAGFPDAYFVEDVAVVGPGIAVITRPGAPRGSARRTRSRRRSVGIGRSRDSSLPRRSTAATC